MTLNKKQLFYCSIVTVFLVIGMSSCQTTTGSPNQAPQATNNQSNPAPNQPQTLWEKGPHANTYVVDAEGTNSTCARCHAPLNYVPSMDDMPASCSSCKFTVDPPPPTTPKSVWENIPCNMCHRVSKGIVSPKAAWLAIVPIDEYEDVKSNSEICLKCHAKEGLPKDHAVIDIAGAHSSFDCTKCHNPHSAVASCTSENCHANVLSPTSVIPGHDDKHKTVTCVACHDAGNLKVGPDENKSWVAFLPETSTPFSSHNIAKKAACERCHFLNNPWKLLENSSKGTP